MIILESGGISFIGICVMAELKLTPDQQVTISKLGRKGQSIGDLMDLMVELDQLPPEVKQQYAAGIAKVAADISEGLSKDEYKKNIEDAIQDLSNKDISEADKKALDKDEFFKNLEVVQNTDDYVGAAGIKEDMQAMAKEEAISKLSTNGDYIALWQMRESLKNIITS